VFVVTVIVQESHLTVFTLNFQCVRLVAGRRIETGDVTDQWRDQPNAMALCATHRQWLSVVNRQH